MIDNHVRREQTVRQLRRVRLAVEDWFKVRADADRAPDDEAARFANLHQTRLATLRQVLCFGLRTLEAEVTAVDVGAERDARAVYAECRSLEQAVLWMERVWLYYAERFDQRRDAARASLLEAADELIWSCYAPAFADKKLLPAGVSRGAAPLAYLDAAYSPATWEASRLAPAELRHATDIDGLQTFLKTLPVPVLRLPTWCLGAPWWLIVIAHEVGHNVQRELDLVGTFEDLIAAACPDPAATRWRRWSPEVFADVYSVLMLGEWAVRALVELEFNEQTRMSAPAGQYPPPAVRLKLLACVADRLGFAGAAAVAGADLDRAAAATASSAMDAQLVNAIADSALGPLPGRDVSLVSLAGTPEQRTDLQELAGHWGDTLVRTPQPAPPKPRIEASRVLACGAWQAWDNAARLPSEATRDTALTTLAANTVDLMRSAGPPGTRAGEGPLADPDTAGVNLAHWLLDRSRQSPAMDDTD